MKQLTHFLPHTVDTFKKNSILIELLQLSQKIVSLHFCKKLFLRPIGYQADSRRLIVAMLPVPQNIYFLNFTIKSLNYISQEYISWSKKTQILQNLQILHISAKLNQFFSHGMKYVKFMWRLDLRSLQNLKLLFCFENTKMS